ncbi:MAG: Fic family protein, partial [Anaerolineaceae bacterium]|nr:Fic family protein [Anaerolineaceae bacterium]
EDLPWLLQRLCDWLNTGFQAGSSNAKQAGVLKAIIAHVYIAWIHPFADGNGRTARLLESRLLCQAGLTQSAANLLSPHYYCTRPEYYRRLERSSQREDGLVGFLRYALHGLVEGLDEWLKVIEYLAPNGPGGWDESGKHPQLIEIEVEHARRVASGAFENPVSLAGKYARPGVSYSDEELRQTLREIQTEWETELDELLADE